MAAAGFGCYCPAKSRNEARTMSLSPRPNLLRAAAQLKALWLAVPAIAVLILLGFLGHWGATPPAPVTIAEAEPSSPATAVPAPTAEPSSTATAAPAATSTAE